VNYMLNDHLGSTNITTDAKGAVVSGLRYKARGEVRYPTNGLNPGPSKYTYTGQYSNVDDFGLMFYNARWYDPVSSRFTQPDTLISSSHGVQAWDRFAYSNNNPVRYNDPSGHCAVCGPIIIAATVALATEFTLSNFGVIPDEIGIMVAGAISIGHDTNAAVMAGIAVQSQYPWALVGGDAQGWAQVKGLENPFSSSEALEAMEKQINRGINKCGSNCTGVDKLITAAIYQNGYELYFPDLPKTTNNQFESIDWTDVFNSDLGYEDDPWYAKMRQDMTGMNYSTEFMMKLFIQDLRALIKLGYDLPEWATLEDLEYIENKYLQ
jgi:RHS repeat-associated protein